MSAPDPLDRLNDPLGWLAGFLGRHPTDEDLDALEALSLVKAEITRLRKLIQADHAYKASIGGSPCICDVCALLAEDIPAQEGAEWERIADDLLDTSDKDDAPHRERVWGDLDS